MATKENKNLPLTNLNNKIGIIIGTDIQTQTAAVYEFMARAKFIDNLIEVESATVGSFSNPSTGSNMANSMNAKRVYTIQNFCGGSGLGIFDASEKKNFYAMVTGKNQNSMD